MYNPLDNVPPRYARVNHFLSNNAFKTDNSFMIPVRHLYLNSSFNKSYVNRKIVEQAAHI